MKAKDEEGSWTWAAGQPFSSVLLSWPFLCTLLQCAYFIFPRIRFFFWSDDKHTVQNCRYSVPCGATVLRINQLTLVKVSSKHHALPSWRESGCHFINSKLRCNCSGVTYGEILPSRGDGQKKTGTHTHFSGAGTGRRCDAMRCFHERALKTTESRS